MRLEDLVGGKIVYVYDGSRRDGVIAFIVEKNGERFAVEFRTDWYLLVRLLGDS